MTTSRPTNLPAPFTRLNLAQALGALNDNLIKLLLVFYLVNRSGQGQAGTVAAIGTRCPCRCHLGKHGWRKRSARPPEEQFLRSGVVEPRGGTPFSEWHKDHGPFHDEPP